MSDVSIRQLEKRFGKSSIAVSNFSLDVEDGELVTFLGPSGCGKTTTLRMIAGFTPPSAGTIHIGDTDVTHVPAYLRGTGMVFQRYALFPHMTVRENVSFGLEMHKIKGAEREKRIRETLEMLKMDTFAERYPRQLSGGQQQRVAIARALSIQPTVFLLDEPLSNLDAKLRVEVREEIRSLQKRLGLTTIFVTHDQEEALAISDRMVIMNDGEAQQVGTPSGLYETPVNLFVADFLGKMNFFHGRIDAARRFITEDGLSLAVEGANDTTQHVGVRPERISLREAAEADNALPGVVESVSYLGPYANVSVRLAGSGQRLSCRLTNSGGAAATLVGHGARVYASFGATDCSVFSE
ncbi:MAG: ABC transporter ATP-binding protein [Castellaniella sp.]|uniref:ABC transporter ATP-binding protein n=1 Tax=Castellaniella sp. TaxID=1955812 RepID=UPI00122191A7|nr:ABC transporter ATP-binding protein [Castellaniella sp.]TAN31626.1 MAG: ABC transporter ATP-binding protein [Castellaniella sp.]